jgi:hypothetical protein
LRWRDEFAMSAQEGTMAMKAKPVIPTRRKATNNGPVTRAVEDVTGAAEALAVGAVHLTRNTLAAGLEAVEDVGGRIGSLAVATVRGATKAASEIGGDLGDLAKDSAEAAGRTLRDAVTGTVAGVRAIVADARVMGNATPRRMPAPAPEPARRPLTRAASRKRSTPAPATKQTKRPA